MEKRSIHTRTGLFRACALTLDIVDEQRRLRRAAKRLPKPGLVGPGTDDPDDDQSVDRYEN